MTDRNLATTDDGTAYDAWGRSKVERALASKLPAVSHDQVMAEVRDIINAKRRTATFPATRRMERLNALNKRGNGTCQRNFEFTSLANSRMAKCITVCRLKCPVPRSI